MVIFLAAGWLWGLPATEEEALFIIPHILNFHFSTLGFNIHSLCNLPFSVYILNIYIVVHFSTAVKGPWLHLHRARRQLCHFPCLCVVLHTSFHTGWETMNPLRIFSMVKLGSLFCPLFFSLSTTTYSRSKESMWMCLLGGQRGLSLSLSLSDSKALAALTCKAHHLLSLGRFC